MSDTTQNQTLEQSLNKTDLGHTLYEYRKVLVGLLLAILVGVTGYLLWKQSQKSEALEDSVKVFEFQSGVWADVQGGKKAPEELVKAFDGLPQDVREAPVMLPVVLEMGKFLYEKSEFEKANSILAKAGTGARHSVAAFFINMQRVAVLEKLGKTDEAIALLEPLAQKKETLLAPRVSVDLGRLYLLKGEKGKAQTQFDYVLTTFPNEPEAKLAKLYLAQIAQ